MKINIGLIGLGFVGGALKKSFEEKNINIVCYDKYKNGGIGNIKDTLQTDITFLCLPTQLKNKMFDLCGLNEILNYYNNKKYEGDVVIKSTLTPMTCNNFIKKYSKLNIVHNPEFLSAKTAYEDFHNQKHIVIGGNSDLLFEFYKFFYPKSDISIMNHIESESLKIFSNSFYSVKIQFFNELYDMCQKLDNCDYNIIKKGIIKNGWVNEQHTSVPGSDGKLSYGGACFPKDTTALLQYLLNENIRCKVLNATVIENMEMRN